MSRREHLHEIVLVGAAVVKERSQLPGRLGPLTPCTDWAVAVTPDWRCIGRQQQRLGDVLELPAYDSKRRDVDRLFPPAESASGLC